MSSEPTVFLVDDDVAVCSSIQMLIESVGLKAVSFSNAQAFLAAYDPSQPGCLVLDVRMPGMSGLELQQYLVERGIYLPVIFITGHGDVQMAVKAMKAGGVEFLEKPFNDQRFVDAVHAAFAKDATARREQVVRRVIAQRRALLTSREKEVMDLLVSGRPTKVVATQLAISRKTVDVHRLRLMKKMQATNITDLFQMSLLDNAHRSEPPMVARLFEGLGTRPLQHMVTSVLLIATQVMSAAS